MEKIPKILALKLGLPEYFTGEPCENNHVTYRDVNTDECFECGLNSKTFIDEFNIGCDTALRRINNELERVTRAYCQRIKDAEKFFEKSKSDVHINYNFQLQNATRQLENKRDLRRSSQDKLRKQYSKHIKIYNNQTEYVRKAQIARQKLEAELEAERTKHLPQRFNDYRDIMK